MNYIMSLTGINFFLNWVHELSTLPESSKFWNLIDTFKNKSGNMFVKQLIIKCLEISVNSELITKSDTEIGNVISKDRNLMCSATPSSVNFINYKLFIGKMINSIYDYKFDSSDFNNIDFENIKDYNFIYDAIAITIFSDEILKSITKETLLKNVVDYMNTLEENDLNNGEKLFSLLAKVFYNMYEKNYSDFANNFDNKIFPKEKMTLYIQKMFEGTNSIFEYVPKYYYDSSSDDDDGNNVNDNTCDLHDDTTKLVDYSSSDNDNNDNDNTNMQIKSVKVYDRETMLQIFKNLNKVVGEFCSHNPEGANSIIEPNTLLTDDQNEYSAMYARDNNDEGNIIDVFKKLHERVNSVVETQKNISNKRKLDDKHFVCDDKIPLCSNKKSKTD